MRERDGRIGNFMPVFAEIPRQSGIGKSRDLRLNTGSLAHRRDGTRLLNFVAALTIKVDLSGPSQICNRDSRTNRRAGSTYSMRRVFLRQWRDDRLRDHRRRKRRRKMPKTWASTGAFPYLHGTAIWLSI